jgi:hypothetical protein
MLLLLLDYFLGFSRDINDCHIQSFTAWPMQIMQLMGNYHLAFSDKRGSILDGPERAIMVSNFKY